MSSVQSPKARVRRHVVITLGGLTLLGVILAFLVKGLTFNTSQLPSALLNKPAKEFSAQWIQGREHLAGNARDEFNLADFKGKPLVLNFWASWCVSCRQEALDLERFWKTKSNQDVAVVGVAVQDTIDNAKAFAMQYGKTYILGLDDGGRMGIDYGVTGVPETFIINRDGVIVHKEAGPVTTEMLENLTKSL